MNDNCRTHRKKIKHFDEAGHLHELTFSCYQRLPLLTNNLWRKVLSEDIDTAKDKCGFSLIAFVFMPNHVHLIVRPVDFESSIPDLLKAIKRPFASRIKHLLEESHSPLLKRLTIRQRPKVTTFRFWQEGPGYDRNLFKAETTLAAIDYLHMNPVRSKLVERAIDWSWSSARFCYDAPAIEIGLPSITRLPPAWLDSVDYSFDFAGCDKGCDRLSDWSGTLNCSKEKHC